MRTVHAYTPTQQQQPQQQQQPALSSSSTTQANMHHHSSTSGKICEIYVKSFSLIIYNEKKTR